MNVNLKKVRNEVTKSHHIEEMITFQLVDKLHSCSQHRPKRTLFQREKWFELPCISCLNITTISKWFSSLDRIASTSQTTINRILFVPVLNAVYIIRWRGRFFTISVVQWCRWTALRCWCGKRTTSPATVNITSITLGHINEWHFVFTGKRWRKQWRDLFQLMMWFFLHFCLFVVFFLVFYGWCVKWQFYQKLLQHIKVNQVIFFFAVIYGTVSTP